MNFNKIINKLLELEIYPNEIRFYHAFRNNKGFWSFEIRATTKRKKQIKHLLNQNNIKKLLKQKDIEL